MVPQPRRRRRLRRSQNYSGPVHVTQEGEFYVNEDILEGQWKQFQGEAKEQWGKLTDDELDRVEGKRDQLVGLLQEKYGYARERAEREVDEFVDELRDGRH